MILPVWRAGSFSLAVRGGDFRDREQLGLRSHGKKARLNLRRLRRVSATSPRYTSIYLLPLVYEVGWRLLTLLTPAALW
jgi:hypothetical protein